jgi:aspartyl/asparaginyl beta-hydroxylase (cupin superfamily)
VGPHRGRGGFVALYPSSQLVAHRDPPITGTRFHVPLVVNDGCWVFHGGWWQQLQLGHLYAMDPTVEHGAVNWGTDRRVHLMVDVEG